MPVEKVPGGYRYGKKGHIYRGKGAYEKAKKQGQAIEIRRHGKDRNRKKRSK